MVPQRGRQFQLATPRGFFREFKSEAWTVPFLGDFGARGRVGVALERTFGEQKVFGGVFLGVIWREKVMFSS